MDSSLNTHDPVPVRHRLPPGRGRPASHENRNVAEDIIRAAEACLAKRSPQQITAKEIASLAGTRPAMVYYYFDSMTGLLTEVLLKNLREMLDNFQKMRDAIRRNEIPNPMRSMISMFASSYNQRPALGRILISELIREKSQIRRFFVTQWPNYEKLILEDVICHLSASGYYRKGINVDGIGTMIRSVIFFPLAIKPYLKREGKSIEHFLDDHWIDFVSNVFECYLRPQES